MQTFSISRCFVFLSVLWTCVGNAEEVLMAFSKEIPPYVFEKGNTGIEIEIIAGALAFKGHTLKPRYYPLGRIPYAFSNKLVNAAMGDMGVELSAQGGFYGDPAVIYQNVFFTLKNRKISITQPKDLDSLKILSFQGANRRYPEWLNKVADENRFYGIGDQLTQAKLLLLGRYDVVLSDRYIFRYFVEQIKLTESLEVHEVDEHKFVKSNPENYRPVFRNKQIRDDFNIGLSRLKESGEFNRIYEKYIKM